MPTPTDDLELILAAQRGDLDSFNALVLRYQNAAYSVAYRLLGEPFSASDAAQEAFINAYRKLHDFRGGSFKAWLLRIVTNGVYDRLRYEKRRPADSIEDLPGAETDDGAPLASHSATPEQVAEQRDAQRAIQDCLGGLPSDQRATLVMFDLEGYSYQEVAETTDVQLGTVKSRLSRARLAMRRCLEGKQELFADVFRFQE
ncbi:MAG: sigma-70 family RNA polymerase sigma factor [Anaerolineae bacterium]|jgi:RNA polymerase sigma-70 factor (ECF subfamily)|nr:sigma-70 family RNA polymerase sigma factor [Anaerolineae bacterium]